MANEAGVNQGPRILVVEDSKFQAAKTVAGLRGAGFEVEVVYDGVECLEKVKRITPDLIVLDIVMPRLDGYETCRRLKAGIETAAIPVVFLTKKDRVMDIIHGLGAGGDNFVTKPYEIDYLVERINAVLENQKLRAAEGVPQEKTLEKFSEEIVLTRDREQILELLLRTLNKNLVVEILGLIVLKEAPQAFLVTAFSDLSQDAQDDFIQKMLAALNAFIPQPILAEEIEPRLIASKADEGESKGGFSSYINVPLLSEGKVVGIFSAASSKEKGFIEDDVKHLYCVGMKAVDALAKITKEEDA